MSSIATAWVYSLVILASTWLVGARLATAAAMDFPPALDTLPMNQVQIIGTHNSYHIQPSPQLDAGMVSILDAQPAILQDLCPNDPDGDACVQRFRYTHESLTTQLTDYAIRQFELDVFPDPAGALYEWPLGWRLANQNPPAPFDPALVPPGFKVLHVQDLDFRTTCFTLISCLTEIRDWSLANPDHLPIMIMIEAKDTLLPVIQGFPFAMPPPFDAAMFDALDAEILSVFSTSHLILPEDIKGARATLRDGVLMDGWPTLDAARGKVYFALDNGGSYLTDYVTGHPSLTGRVMFTNSPSNADEAAFIKRNDPSAADITSLVQQGFLVRTRADSETQEALPPPDTTRRDLAFSTGAHFVSTDYPVPDLSLSTYAVVFAGNMSFRCNPVNSPVGCTFVPEPSLGLLQLAVVGTLFGVRAVRRKQ